MVSRNSNIYHRVYAATEQIDEPLLAKHGVRYARDYLNVVLDELQTHHNAPDRDRNFGLGSFSDHIAPNLGTSAKLQWMLGRSGLVEHDHGVGVYGVSEQRFTDYGAEEITTAYANRKELPSDYRLGDPVLIDPNSEFEYDTDLPTILTQRLGAEALNATEADATEIVEAE